MKSETTPARRAPIIPRPAVLNCAAAVNYALPGRPGVACDAASEPIRSVLLDALEAIGIAAEASGAKDAAIRTEITDTIREPEGYELAVSERGISLRAGAPAGLFYGVQSLLQLVPMDPSDPVRVPCIEIRDAPRFQWRGLLLDVARHFFPVSFIKKLIDQMARHKLNTLHLHLTDDQGWRIEILKYPKLTEVGAWRKETISGRYRRKGPFEFDGTPHGGYYTRDDIREIVAYAAARFVTIVPEIEMPGHATAALAAYPEYANDEGPGSVATRWGILDNTFSPREETFQFLEDVLAEVVALFPGRYIHIGGDEAPKTKWKASGYAQDLMKREDLANEEELQSWFVRRIEKILQKFDRKLIGWDEILEGGLAPDATVMSWRGEKGGIAAAKMGHDVVMTPGFALYFDHCQAAEAFEPLAIGGLSPLEKVYAYDPIPGELTQDEAKYVLGVQANVWTEYMKTPEHVEYMTFPRALALSEVAWTPPELKNWDDFAERVVRRLPILERAGVRCHLPAPTAEVAERADGAFSVTLATLFPDSTIYYTFDDREPNETDPVYQQPIILTPAAKTGTQVTAVAILPDGRRTGVLRSAVGA